MLSLAEKLPVDLRFIELMPIGEGNSTYHVTGEEVLSSLQRMFPGLQNDPAVHGSGPAVYYQIPGFREALAYQCDPREILRKLQSDPSDRSGTFEAMSLLW